MNGSLGGGVRSAWLGDMETGLTVDFIWSVLCVLAVSLAEEACATGVAGVSGGEEACGIVVSGVTGVSDGEEACGTVVSGVSVPKGAEGGTTLLVGAAATFIIAKFLKIQRLKNPSWKPVSQARGRSIAIAKAPTKIDFLPP